MLAGPTLEAASWACPRRPEDLYRIPEPVRHQPYDIGEIITIRGVIGGGDHGEALYPGNPAHLTALPNTSLAPRGMETGHRFFPANLFIATVPDNLGCTTDAAPHAFLVAVDRALAPADEFLLRLRAERLCEECGISWDEVMVRLDE